MTFWHRYFPYHQALFTSKGIKFAPAPDKASRVAIKARHCMQRYERGSKEEARGMREITKGFRDTPSI
jgi:hypothetical protein